MLSHKQIVARLTLPRGPLRCVIDTDTYNEIDDQFAIVWALLAPERFRVEAIYAAPFFNTRSTSPGHGMELSHDEVHRLLDLLDGAVPHPPVLRGVRDYVGLAHQPQPAEAVDDLIARARASSPTDPLYVFAIAAISNIASAILKAPDIVDRIVVIFLGTNAPEWPDQNEFNSRQDVGGVQILFRSGVPLVLVPCNGVTSHLMSTVPEIERWVEPQGRIGAFLAQRFKDYATDHKAWSKEIWDLAPFAFAFDPDWTPSRIVATPTLTDENVMLPGSETHPMRYVYRVRRDPILKDFITRLEAHAMVRQPVLSYASGMSN